MVCYFYILRKIKIVKDILWYNYIINIKLDILFVFCLVIKVIELGIINVYF